MTLCYIPQLIYHPRLFVYYCLAAICLVLKNLQNVDGRVCSMISTLVLGLICLYIANACFHHPTKGFGWEHLIKRYCQQVLEDPADNEDDADAPTIPVLYDNGTYFICDIVLNSDPTFLRLPVQHSFDSESLIHIYYKLSMDNIRSSFNWGAALLSRCLPNPEQTHNHK